MAKRTASQIGKSNRNTGNAFERTVAKRLSEWSGHDFRRRRVQGRDSATIMVESTADIICADSPCRFSIEVKKGVGVTFTSMISNPSGSLFTKFWHQTCYDSKLMSESFNRLIYPMLFFKPDRNSIWVSVSIEGYESLQLRAGAEPWKFSHLQYDAISFKPVSHNVSHGGKPVIETLNLPPCVITSWDEFASHIAPEALLLKAD